MYLSHLLAEMKCSLFGHIPSHQGAKVVVVYKNGSQELVADTICKNCGHFIVKRGTK